MNLSDVFTQICERRKFEYDNEMDNRSANSDKNSEAFSFANEECRLLRVLEETVFKIQIILSIISSDKEHTHLVSEKNIPLEKYEELKKKYDHFSNCDDGVNELLNDEIRSFIKELLTTDRKISDEIFIKNKHHFTPDILDLNQQFEELHKNLKERFKTSSDLVLKDQQYILKVQAEELKNADKVQKLETELQDTRKQKDTKVCEKMTMIQQLEEFIARVESLAADNISQLQTDTANQIGYEQNICKGHISQLQEEIDHLQTRLSQLHASNKEDESIVKKRKFKLEAELENWLLKYDEEITKKQEELDNLSSVHQKELEQLRELEEAIMNLRADYETVMEERRCIQEESERLQAEFERHTKAVILIQAYWRGFFVRRQLKGRNKSGRSSRGKGKKGKGEKRKKKN
ncbi:IQ domain-containing protein D-like [Limulus polyphemus]|uniref:Dynein regulatory complex protein 10 n=1 Tax=Limulus polyphemus TaxID=6850 RepID=A0ABM1TKZ2_LIMPO|nr:IQ domain-containing protein D-like [Limulus polyphemus]XP_022256548.1 IQ domain-containing protein D-like [Limulus polyphemus]XP_022256549.1 IQ domain-containing protein D-like [Limulus polyphemus]